MNRVPLNYRLGMVLPPLLDPHGEPFDHLPCQDAPTLWDDDATPTDKRNAATTCRRACPARGPCWQRRQELGNRATGVWAGRILRSRSHDRVGPLVDDPDLIAWAAAAGVTLDPPTPRGVAE